MTTDKIQRVLKSLELTEKMVKAAIDRCDSDPRLPPYQEFLGSVTCPFLQEDGKCRKKYSEVSPDDCPFKDEVGICRLADKPSYRRDSDKAEDTEIEVKHEQ